MLWTWSHILADYNFKLLMYIFSLIKRVWIWFHILADYKIIVDVHFFINKTCLKMFSIGIYECDFICVNERYFFFVCLSIYIYIYLYLYYDYRNKFNGNYVVLLVGFYYQYYMLQSFLIQSTHNIRDRKKKL